MSKPRSPGFKGRKCHCCGTPTQGPHLRVTGVPVSSYHCRGTILPSHIHCAFLQGYKCPPGHLGQDKFWDPLRDHLNPHSPQMSTFTPGTAVPLSLFPEDTRLSTIHPPPGSRLIVQAPVCSAWIARVPVFALEVPKPSC